MQTDCCFFPSAKRDEPFCSIASFISLLLESISFMFVIALFCNFFPLGKFFLEKKKSYKTF